MNSTAAQVTTTSLLADIETEDLAAIIEELKTLPADASAITSSTMDEPVQITDRDGDPLTAGQAIAALRV